MVHLLSVSFMKCCGTQCCGSGMFIPDPGSWFSPIPDPGSKNSNERQGWKKNLLSYLFCGAIHFTKLNYFIFEMLKKKIWAVFQRIIELLPLEYGFGIRDPEKTYSGSRIQGSKRHRIPDPDPQHWRNRNYFLRFRFRFWFRLLTSSGSVSDFWQVTFPVPVPAQNVDHEKHSFQTNFLENSFLFT